MEKERARIQRLLEQGRITEKEAQKLLEALERRPRTQAKAEKRLHPGYLLAGALFFLASFAVIYILVHGEGTYKRNLIVNPGFERGADGKVSFWTPSAAGAAFHGGGRTSDSVFVWDDKVSHSGMFSISIRNNNGPKTLSWRQQIKVFPKGKRLKLTGFIRSEGVDPSGSASLVIRGLKGLKEETFSATSSMSFDLTGTKDWTRVQVLSTVTDDTQELQVLCLLKGSGTIWCDDLELTVVH